MIASHAVFNVSATDRNRNYVCIFASALPAVMYCEAATVSGLTELVSYLQIASKDVKVSLRIVRRRASYFRAL